MLETGELVAGTYELGAPLGRGGMAEVYRARHRTMDREVALKILPAFAVLDETSVARFLREVKLHSSLSHPHLVKIFDGGMHGDQPYLVLELIQGATLQRRLRAGGVLSMAAALQTARGLADALAYLHRRQVVHRDIKPSNVMIPVETNPILMDFGLARSADSTVLTEDGAMLGTIPYLAPEVFLGSPGGPEGDVRSWALLLHEMLTGSLPYRATTPVGWMGEIIAYRPRSLSAIRDDVPAVIDDLLRACLAHEPEARPGAEQILNQLDGFIERELPRHEPAARLRPSRDAAPTRPLLPSPTRPGITGIAAVLAGSLALGIVAGWRRGVAPSPVPPPESPVTSLTAPELPASLALDPLRAAVQTCNDLLDEQQRQDGAGNKARSLFGGRPVYNGDPAPLFRGLVTLNETIEAADEARFDGPDWLDMGETVRPLLHMIEDLEPAMREGTLRAPLRKLEELRSKKTDRLFRRCFVLMLGTMLETGLKWDGGELSDRGEIYLALYETLGHLPPEWVGSRPGLKARVNALRSAEITWDQASYRSLVAGAGMPDRTPADRVRAHLIALLPELMKVTPADVRDWADQLTFAFATTADILGQLPAGDPRAPGLTPALTRLWDVLRHGPLGEDEHEKLRLAHALLRKRMGPAAPQLKELPPASTLINHDAPDQDHPLGDERLPRGGAVRGLDR